ncbi:2-hydroxyacyl-CoA dehydratase family protein [Rhodococcus opacus]|uniref:2-hydroxyacyl-CoA dehydratase family protein n=1 Tax=Rhodococcus opacus TaxID=37919 RepID=UPI002474EEC2|nr:2-hydroxyacyl-CoA dehydratase family protein [Rhodococcus opacus]MDH6288139.1 benzoyl-CoA reductase/2-hydroxyglutaryl-CoA dehydratase subunit BcrC/BadD/HgdB [Rhodococcus opacus]
MTASSASSASSASAQLRRHYDSRLDRARAAAADGTAVIGVVGADVPPEILESCGALAYRLSSVDRSPSPEAITLLGGAVDATAYSILDQILAGDVDFLRGLVVSRDSQASLRVFYVLRALAAQGRPVPPVHLLDVLHLRRKSTRRYNTSQIAGLTETITLWTGRPHTLENLRAAQTVRARLGCRLVEVRERRRSAIPTVSGVDALRLYALSQTAEPTECIALAEALLADPSPIPAGPRVFLTGSPHDHDHAYAALESAGARLVGDDHSWGDAVADLWPVPAAGDDLDSAHSAIALHRLDCGVMAQTSGLTDRAGYSAEGVRRAAADAVLSLVRRNDPAPDWDFPALVREVGECVRTEKVAGGGRTWPDTELREALQRLTREDCEVSAR